MSNEELERENKALKEVLVKCLKARQVNHVRKIIKEAAQHIWKNDSKK